MKPLSEIVAELEASVEENAKLAVKIGKGDEYFIRDKDIELGELRRLCAAFRAAEKMRAEWSIKHSQTVMANLEYINEACAAWDTIVKGGE